MSSTTASSHWPPRDDAEGATAPTSGSPGFRKYVLLAIAAIVLVAGAWFLIRTWQFAHTHESTDNAQVDGHIVPVYAKVGGYVQRVLVAENQSVTAGDTLVVIDDSEYRARLAQAAADLEAARVVAGGHGVAGQSEAQVRGANSQRDALEAQAAAAQAAVTKAHADLARMRELADKQVVSRQQLDAAQSAAAAADANLKAIQEQIAGAAAGVQSAEAGTRLARARLAAAQAQRDNAALQLEWTRIIATRSGRVSKKQVEQGQLVQAGQPLLTIVDDKDVWVTANFKETQLASIKVGMPVTIDVDTYPGCTVTGVVESVSAATAARFALIPPDNATGNFTKVVQRIPVRLRIDHDCGEGKPLRPGMSVEAHVRTR
jgi:membrane fusion protein (multidrug efflux system)